MVLKKSVTIYTDGACLGNPGPGGYAAILIYGEIRKEITGGFRKSTNNRMELMAAIFGLQALKEECQVILWSDSEYLVSSMSLGRAKCWRARNWRRTNKEMAANVDLWEQILALCDRHEVQFEWVKGHSGNRENELCDMLAVQAAKRASLPIDSGFEQVAESP